MSWFVLDILMRIKEGLLHGLLLIEPQCFHDERGFFLESFHAGRYRAHGIAEEFVQDNHSRSRGRGLHFRINCPQAQIVTVIRSRVFDVVVDLRHGSATFGHWNGVELSDKGPRQLYMPPGFAHGFCMLSEFADLQYKVSQLYDGDDETGLIWNDRDVSIRWPIANPIVSARDSGYPALRQLDRSRLPQVGPPS